MTNTLFAIPAPVLAAIDGASHSFPVRRLFCIGRNYAAHAREMGKDPTREPPFFFTKWAETVVPSGSTIGYPPGTENFHYEAELVVAIGAEGFGVKPVEAEGLIFGYAAGLDMTRRDLQLAARELGRPWDSAKNVPQSAPLGAITPRARAGAIATAAIKLTLNGVERQSALVSDLIWPVPELIAEVSALYRLMPGDLIYTGTPAGVGAVKPGDRLRVTIDGLAALDITVGPAWA